MNFTAASWFLLAFWMPHDQLYSQPEDGVFTTGAGA